MHQLILQAGADGQHGLIGRKPGRCRSVLGCFLEYLNVICAKKKNSNLFQLLFEENFFVDVLLICENVCKRSLFLINFSVEICKRYN